MRKAIYIYAITGCTLGVLMLATACENKSLDIARQKMPDEQNVAVCVEWGDDRPSTLPPKLRFNIISLNQLPTYGVDEVSSDGQCKIIKLAAGYHGIAFCYDYEYNNYRFDSQSGINIQATSPRKRSPSYEKYIHPTVAPDEETVADLPSFFVSTIPEFDVEQGVETTELKFCPTNVLRRYSFIIRNVKGARHVSAARGAITGMAATYKLASGPSSDKVSTILFQDEITVMPDKEDGSVPGTIEGGFYAFGPVESSGVPHYFSIELETVGGNFYYCTWDVTAQMNDAEGSIPVVRGRNQSRAIEVDFDLMIDNWVIWNVIGGGNADGPWSESNPRKDDGNSGLPPIERGNKDHGDKDQQGGFQFGVEDWNNVDWNLN